jgi:hypothetical protein
MSDQFAASKTLNVIKMMAGTGDMYPATRRVYFERTPYASLSNSVRYFGASA